MINLNINPVTVSTKIAATKKAATKKVKITKKVIVQAIFNAGIAQREELGNITFRHLCLIVGKKAANTTSMPVLYNAAKKQAILQNLTNDYGRGIDAKIGSLNLDTVLATSVKAKMQQAANIVLGIETVAIVQQTKTVAIVQHDKWLVVDKHTNSVIASAASKNKAYKLRNGNTAYTVRKAAE